MEGIRKVVESPEFQAAKQKAAQAGRDASAALTRRIEEVLTDEQRTTYHKLLGEPFELSKLRFSGRGQDERRSTSESRPKHSAWAEVAASVLTPISIPRLRTLPMPAQRRTRGCSLTRHTIIFTRRAAGTSRLPN